MQLIALPFLLVVVQLVYSKLSEKCTSYVRRGGNRAERWIGTASAWSCLIIVCDLRRHGASNIWSTKLTGVFVMAPQDQSYHTRDVFFPFHWNMLLSFLVFFFSIFVLEICYFLFLLLSQSTLYVA
jgi:hypothetical protein